MCLAVCLSPFLCSPLASSNALLDIYWEGAGPTEVGDRVHTSLPTFMMKELHKRVTKDIAEADKCVRA